MAGLPFTRRCLISRAAQASGAVVAASAAGGRLLAAAPPARAAAAAPLPPLPPMGPAPLRDADYLALMDQVARRLDRTWREEEGTYTSGGGGIDVIYNAALLTVHAVAAERGHGGPSRADDRARLLVDRLVAGPPFFEGRSLPRRDTMFHTPGWVSDLHSYDSAMDKAIDPKVAEALVAAWRAGDVLGLDADRLARIVDRVDRVARARFFRYPNVRLNQINWNAELYAYAALLTGNPELLREDYRNHVRRFVRGVRRPLRRDGTTNLSPSYRFHYIPHWKGARSNVDSAEYANITVHFILHYEQALAAGMRPLPEDDMAILRAWTERVQFGYWMHSGMLNWESGLGFGRWMKAKTWAYAQQGLLAIAAAPRFHRDPRQGAWAKDVFDRGLGLYERQIAGLPPRRMAPAHLYGVTAAPQGVGSQRIFNARMGANAARALTLGLGAIEGAPPPPVYAFDADVGRLAVSTPRYGAAVIVDNGGAFPWGGIDLARLFDGAGTPVGGIGGRPPAAFGILIRGAGNRRLFTSQTPRRHSGRLVLSRSPRGRVTHLRNLPIDPDAGPFTELEAVGTAEGRHAMVTARHTFTAGDVETAWEIRRRGRRRSLRVEALFPTWGEGARIEAVRPDGTAVPLATGGGTVALADVAWFHLAGPRGGYVLVCLEAPAGSARAIRVSPQRSAPRAGPTLVLELARGGGFSRAALRVRITPAADTAQARAAAARLTA
jgi:hypothetical protein